MSSIETLEVAGIKSAIHAMRNPYDSWDKTDTTITYDPFETRLTVGPADKELSMRLAKAGTEHCKHLRMVEVWADISMPLYWWKEFDTYRTGVEKVSCSTMHKIHSRYLTFNDFQNVSSDNNVCLLEYIIPRLNGLIEKYKKSDYKDKDVWYTLVAELPSSYIQKRTVMMSYAALRQIYNQRRGHKLNEWHEFREWIRTLPESWMITDENE